MVLQIGNKLHELRINSGATQKQIGDIVGVSHTQIGNIENGLSYPSIPTLIRLAKYYNVSSDYILGISGKDHSKLSLEGLTPQQIQIVKLITNEFLTIKSK